jgi:hypothetical protein
MAIVSYVCDESTGRSVEVGEGGVLKVGPIHPSLSFNATLGTDDVAVNIVPAKAGHVFFLTGLLLTANQNVSNTVSATVTIYTGDAENTAKGSALTTLFTVPLQRNDTRDITGILVESEEGKWINGETTDDDVFVTVLGYYLKREL